MSNLFEMFGEAVPDMPKFGAKKEPKKKESSSKNDAGAKKNTDSKTGSVLKKEPTFQSPLSVYVGGNPSCFILEKDGNITISDVKEFAASKMEGYPSDLTVVHDAKTCAVVYLNGKGMVKGQIEVGEGCRLYYGTIEFDISELLSGGTNIEVDKLNEVVRDTISAPQISYLYSKDKNILSIQLLGSGETEIPSPKKEITVLMESGEEMPLTVVSGEEQLSQISLPGLGLDMEEQKPAKKLKVNLNEWLPDSLKGHPLLHLVKSEVKGRYYFGCTTVNASAKSAPAAETLYETENSMISLVWDRYNISPDMFGGKKKVTFDEILAFLVEKGNKEFAWLGKSDVSIQWNAKNRCILVSLKSSKKGADVASFLLPKKIPFAIAAQWVYFSKLIYSMHHTEVLMDLYYDPKTDNYLWYVPKQVAYGSSLNARFESFLQSTLCGLRKIGQFHSHGSIPAFFSSKDDDDEILRGIYGVIGSIGREKQTFAFRLIDEEGSKRELAFDELFSYGHINSVEEIAGWKNQVMAGPPFSTHFSSLQEGYPLVQFENGVPGLLLSSPSEAEFIRHVDGFYVTERSQEQESLYIAVSNDYPELSEAFDILDERRDLYSLY